MKKITIPLIMLLFSLCTLAQQERLKNFPKTEQHPKTMPAPENFWIFMMAGQSNMAGRGLVEPQDTVPNLRILTLDTANVWVVAKEPLHRYQPKLTGMDSGVSFARELLRHVGDSITIGLVPCAVGGSSVDRWLDDSLFNRVHLYSNFAEKLTLAKNAGTVKAILWHQGESDANKEKIVSYKEKLITLFSRFRAEADNDTLPIIMGELGSYYYPEERQAYWDSINVRIREVALEDKYIFEVPTSDLTPNQDRIHFDAASQRELGKRYAKTWLKISSLRR